MARVPGRGDLYRVDLEPTKGKEQRGRRYVFVLSPAEHNRRGLVIALTDRQGETLARSAGYAATLEGAGLITQGVVLCHQPRAMDFAVRGARYIESAPRRVVDDLLSRVAPLVT